MALNVIVAAIAAMAIGAVYYSPGVMGKKWIKAQGWTESKAKEMHKDNKKSMVWGFIATLIAAYVLAKIMGLAGAVTVGQGVAVGFWAWLGFVATTQIGSVLWEGKSTSLFYINTVHSLISFVIMGAVLGAF
tara:strand:+ start:907 stop:1302 length:396 start_codon:yes stop_codon:yes gene_type:complete